MRWPGWIPPAVLAIAALSGACGSRDVGLTVQMFAGPMDADDLQVISALSQDSVFPTGEMRWERRRGSALCIVQLDVGIIKLGANSGITA